VFIILEWFRRLLHRFGVVRTASTAERELADPEQAWRLVEDPGLWTLWMPTVLDRIDPARPPRPDARYRFTLRRVVTRTFLGGASEGTVLVDEYVPGLSFSWRLIAARGKGQQVYTLRQHGAVTVCQGNGGPPAAEVLAELDRQSRP
jgi:hypothetical protein